MIEKVLLIAVLSFIKLPNSDMATGYQSTVMHSFESEAECRAAAIELLKTYRQGNVNFNKEPDGASVRCVTIQNGQTKSSVELYTKRSTY
jgi:hypothetical protein